MTFASSKPPILVGPAADGLLPPEGWFRHRIAELETKVAELEAALAAEPVPAGVLLVAVEKIRKFRPEVGMAIGLGFNPCAQRR
jgi:hypothetical protein